MKFFIGGLVLFIGAYATALVLYINSGMGYPHEVTERQSDGDGTTVTLDLEDVRSNNTVLVTNLTITPAASLLDPVTHKLKEDLDVEVSSVVTPSKRTFPKGTVPDVVPVLFILSGDEADWPFDRYRSKPITVELDRGAAEVPTPASVIFVDRLLGWKVKMSGGGKVDPSAPYQPYQVFLSRTSSTVAFGVVIVLVYLAIAGMGLFVAVQTRRDKRKFQPPMTTWYAAMLFAVIPLRNAVPDAPPFGSWIDVTVVVWVIVALVFSMLLYISSWWRHLRPDVEKSRSPAESRT
jgi:hypothetical protein